MKKKMDLKAFNLYEYLKEHYSPSLNSSFILADQNTYKSASVRFPFRTFTYGIGLTYSGDPNNFRIGSSEFTFRPGSLSTVGPGIVCQWLGGYGGEHDTVYFTEDLFKDTLKNSYLKSLPFFDHGGNHVIDLDDMQVEQVRALFHTLKQFKNDKHVVTGIVYSLLMLTVKCHETQLNSKQNSFSHKEKTTRDFKSLLSKYFLEHKDVVFYAEQLNITPKYLSEILLSETGKTAKGLIMEQLFLEAKSLLRQTSMTVQEICYWLGFSDTSYFTKAFKKQEKVAPLAYRKI